MDNLASTRRSGGSLTHNREMAQRFLKALDPTAQRFTFQLLRDPPHRKSDPHPPGLRPMAHCSVDEALAMAKRWNTLQQGYGLFFTPNETDFLGRAKANIVRVRAVFVDIDENLHAVIARIKGLLPPSAIVQSSWGRAQVYWWVDGFELDAFEMIQKALAAKFGTDPSVIDRPRLMRLPGSLHLKGEPQLVFTKLGDPRRYSLTEIVDGLQLARFLGAPGSGSPRAGNILPLPQRTPLIVANELAAGIEGYEINFAKVRSALTFAAKAGLIKDYNGYRDTLLFPLTNLAQQHPNRAEEIEALYREIAALGGGNTAQNQLHWDTAVKNRPNTPRTIGSVYMHMKTGGWQWSEPAEGDGIPPIVTGAGKASVIPRPLPIDGNFLPRHRQFLLGTRLMRSEVTVLAAPGGRGKTAFAIAAVCSLASGKKLLHDAVYGGSKKVVLFSTEDGREELRRRLIAAKQHFNLTQSDLDHIHVAAADTGRFTLTSGPDKQPLINQPVIDELGAIVRELKADVLVLDPLGPLVPVGLNDNGLMGQLLLALKQMAAATDCAVMLVHHFKKASDGSAESISGASAIVNHARVALTLAPMTQEEGRPWGILPSEYWRYFRVIDSKTNFAPPTDGADFLKLESVVLNNPDPPVYADGDRVQVATPVVLTGVAEYLDSSEKAQVRDEVLWSVQFAMTQGSPPHITARGGAKGATTITDIILSSITRHTKRPTRDAQIIAAALYQEMLRDNLLAETEVKSPNRHKRRGVVLGAPEGGVP